MLLRDILGREGVLVPQSATFAQQDFLLIWKRLGITTCLKPPLQYPNCGAASLQLDLWACLLLSLIPVASKSSTFLP